ncbi:MAG: YicC/YloC family endoribonuclease [Phycisphaerae bacterium]
MILSMTGYGAATAVTDGVSYSVEIRSLNNRHFKATIKLPEGLQSLELEIDKRLRGKLTRGSITFSLRMRDTSSTAAYDVNIAAIRSYVEQLSAVQPAEGRTTIDLASLLDLPGVCDVPQLTDDDRRRRAAVIERVAAEAVSELLVMRRREGAAMLTHLQAECDAIRRQADAVRVRAPVVLEEYLQRLQTRVNRLLSQAQLDLDKDTLAREVAIYADRCDINEELTRLNAHLDQFLELCASEEASGRRLDFLAQELLREANTMGSKSNDVEISQRVVEIKAAIERIKELVQNVE